MTYAAIKRKVLELIDRYSVAGEAISPAYNGQSDYIRRIPGLINDAVLRLRTEYAPVSSSCTLGGGTNRGGMEVYSLPRDCRGVKTGGVFRIDDGGLTPVADYRILGHRSILLPNDGNRYMVEYYYFEPDCLLADPFDTSDLDETPEILTAACYYAAAMLLMDENEFAYAALYNEYQSRADGIALTACPPTAEISPIRDVYGFY